MSYFRSYFQKNNTLLKGSHVNTSKYPTTEIYYGIGYSRFIFKLDLTNLKEKISNGDLMLNNDTRHILNLTNTIFGDHTLIGDKKITEKVRATSFDLILFNIPEYWDEGVGYDYKDIDYDFTFGNKTYNEQPSNWYNRTVINPWISEGVYENEPEIITKIHFDNGNENINVDVTDYINDILNGETYHGTGLCFDIIYETLDTKNERSVSFFTKYTQTFYEPFLESQFKDNIFDNRNDFVGGIKQNLYLIVNNGTEYIDLDQTPIVDIKNGNGDIIISDHPTEKVRKGIYKFTVNLSDDNIDGRMFYTDTWKNIILDGREMSDVEQEFLPKKLTTKISFEQPKETDTFSFRVVGIKQDERIKRGDIKKISLHYTTINKKALKPLDKVYYRIFIWEGRSQVTVHDWTIMDKTTENSFLFDSSFYIPREYSIEFKVENNGEIKHYRDTINFEIISEK